MKARTVPPIRGSNRVSAHQHQHEAQAGATRALCDLKTAEAPLPDALNDLSNILSSAEANQSALESRLRRVLEPVNAPRDPVGKPEANTLEPHLVEIVANLITRVRDLIESQSDILARLHV